MASDQPTNMVQAISLLKDMAEKKLLDNTTLASLLKDLVTGKKSGGQQVEATQQVEAPKPKSPTTVKVMKAINSSRKRTPSSPETCLIRRCIENPIRARFEYQCALPGSVLFSAKPPKRLNKPLFEAALESPLKKVYKKSGSKLHKVSGKK